ncbi:MULTISPECIES: class I SAM-dependent methyltransferase [Listeria]|uniref:class I SAM-dependent methyltransferase n=1 Tax=Listeria TaxID=1637 RepID=UPI0010D35270|nr:MULTISPECIES: class I SAM-dependent methyltransferase [Listeria]EAG8233301.1 SAM-dependent methyltransferase [Listeria monocytogenes]EAG8239216.1 SAM-dependent methyltransferase [Listeria monocytogenes]EAH0155670.1 SAM-dependent methyltransferase [Listeria monocytogenes]EAH3095599.1 SAM-dependent methyltransferase [Listeria monocytogenes]EAH4135081.1 SAM-dependent methyltransferase [Listeria monocytogenes]
MNEKNMTALVSCFAKAYHYDHNSTRIFSDNLAKNILSQEEYAQISMNMKEGISYFNPSFKGTSDDALRWIVDNQLSPSVLGRSIFCESELLKFQSQGCNQYLIYASGYDTFAYRHKEMKVFEIDRDEMIKDKQSRVQRSQLDTTDVNYISADFTKNNWIESVLDSAYDSEQLSFSSLLGISYYLTTTEFEYTLKLISEITQSGSLLMFDYPSYEGEKETELNEELAEASNEKMKSKYSIQDIERILEKNGYAITRHLNHEEMTDIFFEAYNLANSQNQIQAPNGVNYCLAEKKNSSKS